MCGRRSGLVSDGGTSQLFAVSEASGYWLTAGLDLDPHDYPGEQFRARRPRETVATRGQTFVDG
jgi:hypothetical protein